MSKTAKMWPTPRGEGTRVIENPEAARARMDRLKAEGQQTGGIRNLAAEARMFPTPVADGDRQTNYQQGGTALGVAARMWPTPTSSERPERDLNKRIRDKRQIGISEAVRMFPTPRAGKTTDEDEESWLETRRRQGRHATAGIGGEDVSNTNKP